MAETHITVSEALDDALDFARGAWRDAWLPMMLTAAGWALLVVAGNGQLSDGTAAVLRSVGIVLLLFHIPLLGALYRSALGWQAYQGLGPGGLQIGGAESRLLVVNALIGFFAVLACAPMVLLSGLFYMVLRRFDGVTLGPLGHWEWWFLSAGVFWLTLAAVLLYLAGRLSLATPLSIENRRIMPLDSWILTPGHGLAIAVAFIFGHLPTLLVLIALMAFGWVEGGVIPMGMHGPWPLPEALGAGVLAGLLLAGLQAPLSVGLITIFYDVLAPVAEAEPADAVFVPVEPPREETAEHVVSPEENVPEHPAELDHPSEGEPAAEHEPQVEAEAEQEAPEREADAEASHEPEPEAASEPEPEVENETHGSASETVSHVEPESESEAFPHSVVEFSPHSGRFTRLFSPWLSHEHPPGEAVEGHEEPVNEVEAHFEPVLDPHAEAAVETPVSDHVEPEGAHPPAAEVEDHVHEVEAFAHPLAPSGEVALDGANEPEHAEP